MNRSTNERTVAGLAGIYAAFAANGFLFATWVSRLPAVRARLGATEPQLGAVLLCIAIGCVTAMPLASRLFDRFGLGRMLTAAMVVAAVGFQGAVAAPSLAVLAAALGVAGAGVGIWDVAINASAHAAERAGPRPLMPSFHGAFSLGALGGAGLGALAAAAGLPAPGQMALAGLAVGAIGAAAGGVVPTPAAAVQEPTLSSGRDHRRRAVPLRLVLLGLLAACTALGEGAAADWGPVFLHDERGASESIAALGYAFFSLAMAVGRLSGHHSLARLTRVGAVRVSGVSIAAALALLVAAHAVPVALLAMVGWGLAVAIVFPAAMSAAAEHAKSPAHGIAVVSTIGYCGFLVGPPAIGLAAGHVGLGGALVIVAVLGLVLAALAPVAAPPDAPELPPARCPATVSGRAGSGRPARLWASSSPT